MPKSTAQSRTAQSRTTRRTARRVDTAPPTGPASRSRAKPLRAGGSSKRSGQGEVAALDRAATLLMAVADSVQPTPLSKAAQKTGLSKATAFRILSTLAAQGMIVQDEAAGSSYRLGVMPLRLATAVLQAIPVRSAARPSMRTLSQALDETVVLSVQDGDNRFNIDAVECSNAISSAKRFGEPRPLHAGAASRVLLAAMDDAWIAAYLDRATHGKRRGQPALERGKLLSAITAVRKSGVSSTLAEVSLDAHAVAAAIRTADGRAIAALHVAIPRTRFNSTVERKCIRALKAAVSEIEQLLAA